MNSNSGPPPEQDIPLQVPKKTKLYVEQVLHVVWLTHTHIQSLIYVLTHSYAHSFSQLSTHPLIHPRLQPHPHPYTTSYYTRTLPLTQTQREREHAPEIHRAFQRDLCKMRLEASRAYVKTLTDGQMVCTHIRLFEDVCVRECTFFLHCTRAYVNTHFRGLEVRCASCTNRSEKSWSRQSNPYHTKQQQQCFYIISW
jgi:hypothetical protein